MTDESWYWLTTVTAGLNALLVWKASAFYWYSLEPEHRATALALTIFVVVLLVFTVVSGWMAYSGGARPPWIGAAFQLGLNGGFGWLYYKLYFNGPSANRIRRS